MMLLTYFLGLLLILTHRVWGSDNSISSYRGSPIILNTHQFSSGLEVDVHWGHLRLSPNQDGVVEVNIPDESQWLIPGEPILPRIVRWVVLPSGYDISVEWEGQGEKISLNAPIARYENPDFKDLSITIPFSSDTSPYFPPEVVKKGEVGIMAGVRLTPLVISPVQWDKFSNSLTVWEDLRVRIDFVPSFSHSSARESKKRIPNHLAQVLKPYVLNGDALMDFIGEDFGSYVYVIPDYQGVRGAIDPLVKWRIRKGYPTQVIVVSPNASNVEVKRAIQSAYDNWDIPPEFITLVGDADLQNADFMIPTWDVGRAYMWETDYKYVLLDGPDLLPEAAIGRISCRSLEELRMLVDRIVRYESDPYLDEIDWYLQGAVMANDPRTGYSSYYLQQWARRLMLESGYTSVDTFYFMHNNPVSGQMFIRNNINRGVAIFHYRGWGQFGGDWAVGDAFRYLRNGRKMPLWLIPTCNSGDFADHVLSPHAYTEDLFWASGGGCIGAIGSGGYTHTNYNNVLAGGILNALFRDSIVHIGWALNRGKLELYRQFGLFNDIQDPQVQNLLIWEAHAYQYNLIGDAGSAFWTGVPKRMVVTHPEEISTASNNLLVRVITGEGELPLSGMWVTLVRRDGILRVAKSDEHGSVLFTFQPGELTPDTLALTVYGNNYIPYLGNVVVRQPRQFLGYTSFIVDDDNAGRSRGNGDRNPNPGETIELRVFFANLGDSAINGSLVANLTIEEGSVEVIQGQINLGDAPPPGDSLLGTFLIRMGQDNWDGRQIVGELRVIQENQEWRSSLTLVVAAPKLDYVRHSYFPPQFNPADTVWLDVVLRNRGRQNSPRMQCRLVSRSNTIVVHQNEGEIPPIFINSPDSLATVRFRIYAHHLTIPGSLGYMTIALVSDQGFRDTVNFSLTVGESRQNAPLGPDEYGYVAFDDTDEQWEVAPQYEWVEIDPQLGGPGNDTGIRDLGNEQDFSVLVDLPFAFKYYGEVSQRVTICSNGWFSFADERRNADFQNRRIPPAFGPRAQVCVFWDDLINYTDRNRNPIGGIFTWYDEENHRFIIEWSRMRRYIGMVNDSIRIGGENTFQAILYDPQYYPTYTGDGEIVFQYHTVNNDPDIDPGEYDTPYATVGITNLDATRGLEYSYWNRYPTAAAPLRAGRAIKFTTKVIVIVGYVEGIVTDAATGEPIPRAEIRGSRGSFAITNAQGFYRMDNVLVGSDYSFTAWAPGYNDSTLSGFNVIEGETLRINFSLLHPELVINVEEITGELQPGATNIRHYQIGNSGNGVLEYRTIITYPEMGGDWRRIIGFPVTERTGDYRINGVDFFDGAFWVTGSNNNENPNKFYRFSPDGEFLGAIDQPVLSAYGVRGMSASDTVLYGGEGSWVLGFNRNGEIVDSIPSPLNLVRALAYDRSDGTFWGANGRLEPLVHWNRAGEELASFTLELDIYGLGIYPDDTEGYTVYIFSRNKTNPALPVPEALVSRFNPMTGDLRVVTAVEGSLEDRAGGMEITTSFDPHKWVMVAVLNNPQGHKVSVYDIGPNTRWLRVSPRLATILPGETVPFQVLLNAENLQEGIYRLLLKFLHNARGLETIIPVTLTVDRNAQVDNPEEIPTRFALNSLYPNPFNTRITLDFSLPKSGTPRAQLYDILGREVRSFTFPHYPSGRHQIGIDFTEVPGGLYLLKFQWENHSVLRKVVLIK